MGSYFHLYCSTYFWRVSCQKHFTTNTLPFYFMVGSRATYGLQIDFMADTYNDLQDLTDSCNTYGMVTSKVVLKGKPKQRSI